VPEHAERAAEREAREQAEKERLVEEQRLLLDLGS